MPFPSAYRVVLVLDELLRAVAGDDVFEQARPGDCLEVAEIGMAPCSSQMCRSMSASLSRTIRARLVVSGGGGGG
jgi:hypothetical protein